MSTPTPPHPAGPRDVYDIGLPPLGPFDEALRLEADVRAPLDHSRFDPAEADRVLAECRTFDPGWGEALLATPTPLASLPVGEGARPGWAEVVATVERTTRHGWSDRTMWDLASPGLTVAVRCAALGVDDYVRRLADSVSPLEILTARCVLPYASSAAVDDLRAAVSARSCAPADLYRDDLTSPALEALLGGEPSPREHPTRVFYRDLQTAFALRSPQERAAYADELQLVISYREPRLLFCWLVATGSAGFPTALRSIATESARWAGALTTELTTYLDGPGAVPLFVDLLATPGAPQAREWLAAHMDDLLRTPVSDDQATRLVSLLRTVDDARLRDPGLPPALAAVAADLLAERAVPAFDPATPWWDAATQRRSRPARLPQGVEPASVTPLHIGGTRLAPDQTGRLLADLQHAPATSPLAAAVREHVDEEQRDDFVLALIDLWLSVNGPTPASWMMIGAARLGGPRTVRFLAQNARHWPNVAQHRRAKDAVAALAATGSDLAVAELTAITERRAAPALRRAAHEQLEAVAAARGLTRAHLEDRLVPTAGLDEHGSRLFDTGGRQFRATLGPDGRLTLRQLVDGRPTGRSRTTLPAPVTADDPELMAAAKADLATTKRALRGILTSQRRRYEAAMVSGLRWSAADHHRFVASHPVLRPLLAGVVWGVQDGAALAATARVDEEGALVDAQDDPVAADGRTIGVVHPVELPEADRAAWARVMSDYELVAPFPQLTRPVFRPAADQGDDVVLHGLRTGTVATTSLVRALERYGWERGAARSRGNVVAFTLPHEAAGLTAVLYLTDGLLLGWSPADQPDQGVAAVDLLPGIHPGSRVGYRDERPAEPLPWSRAPLALASEVLATVHEMGLR